MIIGHQPKDFLLAVEALTVSFDGFKAVNDLSFYVDENEIRVIIGPNGAGKTTVLDLICGKTKATSGSIKFRGQELTRLKENQIVGCSVTLRGPAMWEFLYRLLAVALPTIRDFRGVPSKFDGQGNYNLGVTDFTIFPEITVENVKKQMGLDITIVTTAQTDDEGRELLKLLGMPFRRVESAAPKATAA